MYHDVEHEEDCRGMRYAAPDMRDCTCGKIIDCLLAEREHLQRQVADHEEAHEDRRRLVRELDVALNGSGAALQASLCDIVAQVKDDRFKLVKFTPRKSKPFVIDERE